MKKSTKDILNTLWFLVVFLMTHLFAQLSVSFIFKFFNNNTEASTITTTTNSTQLIIVSVIGSILTIALFIWRKWTPFHRHYIQSRPWATLIWVILLALGSILPLQWIYEQTQIAMPDHLVQLFKTILGDRWGYLAVGILVPIAEEMVFRGAILRTLLQVFKGKMSWFAIFVSALLFGAVHGNLLQGLHASLIGFLLGWLYYRSGSIIPGIVYHWVNNTVAYLMYNLMPQMADGKLIDLFHGNTQTMLLGIFFSLCIFIPSLYQLYVRMERKTEKDFKTH